MPEFLVFQLYGALASWGDIAVGEHRPSLGHPSKSAITGLLAAALGIKREDDAVHAKLNNQYAVAVCVRAPGELLRDYHTVQVPSGKRDYASRRDELMLDKQKLKTLLSQRDYRTDAFYQIAVWSIDSCAPYTLSDLRQALQQPQFNLYLGRKSCPLSLPLHPVVLSVVSLKQAFEGYPLSKAEACIDRLDSSALVSFYWEQGNLGADELGLSSTMTYPCRDQVGSRKRWQFTNRDEYYFAEAKGGK